MVMIRTTMQRLESLGERVLGDKVLGDRVAGRYYLY